MAPEHGRRPSVTSTALMELAECFAYLAEALHVEAMQAAVPPSINAKPVHGASSLPPQRAGMRWAGAATMRRSPAAVFSLHFAGVHVTSPFAPIDAAPGLPGRGVVGVRAVGEPNTQWPTAFSGCAAVPEPTRSGWQCHALGAVACQDRWRRKPGEHQQCSSGCLAGRHAPRRSWSSAWSIGLRLLRALGKTIAVAVGRLAGVPVTARGRSQRRNRGARVHQGATARAYATWPTAAGLNTLSE